MQNKFVFSAKGMSNDLFDLYAAAFGKVRQNAVNYTIGVTMRKAQSKVAKTYGMTKRQTAQTLGEARRKRTEAITQKIMKTGSSLTAQNRTTTAITRFFLPPPQWRSHRESNPDQKLRRLLF